MKTRQLSHSVPPLFPIGLGCMAMSEIYGTSDREESIATIREAIDRGVQLIDTGDFYGMGHNEMLIAEALKGIPRDKVFIQVKFGALRDPRGSWIGFDGRPQAVKTALAYSLKRLNTDYIDVYYPARLDSTVPIEETVGAIAQMVKAGYVRHIGLSEVGMETVRRASAAAPIAELQIEYSLMSRSIERDILQGAREMGIGITAYGVLSRGLLGGKSAASMEPGDYRAHLPRWRGENEARNLGMAQQLAEFARQHDGTAAQLAMAWVLSRGDQIIPLAGARTRKQLNDLLGALDLQLTERDLAEIERIVDAGNVAGERYDARGMATLDSER